MTNEEAENEIMQIYGSLSEEKKQALDVLMAQADGEKSFKMRDATPEEQKSVDDYIKSISKPTGINFWDLDYNDDCISRKAVLSLLADHFDNVFDMVKELPSVAIPPEHDGCKDCKYETYPEYYYPCCDCKQNYEDEWQKKPHWIIIDDCEKFIAKCSECGQIEDSRMIGKYAYCHCGARMVEPQESEVRNEMR